MSQNPYIDAQKLLREIAERYEEMFAQFSAMRQVFKEQAQTDSALIARYSDALDGLREQVHSDFAPLNSEIQRLSDQTLASTLISKIPRVPTQ